MKCKTNKRASVIGRVGAKILAAALPLAVAATGCAGDEGEGPGAQSANVTEAPGARLSGVSDGKVLTINEDALAAKIQVIETATELQKQGQQQTLDLTYFIFSDDESSAYMASKMVEAAQAGVKVRLLVDFLTNFARHKYFQRMMADGGGGGTSGNGNLQVSYFNTPPAEIQNDVRYMVTPCSLDGVPITDPRCNVDRHDRVNSDANLGAEKAEMFLTGLYGKNDMFVQASMAEVAAQYDEAQEAGGEMSTADKAGAVAGMQLLFNAKVKGSFGAQVALFFLADRLTPITGAAGSANSQGFAAHSDDWGHLTDYTHQKLTLRTGAGGDSELVLGGRNVENSYHVSKLPSDWSKKYVFMDTDFYAKFKGDSVRQRFDKMWNFKAMSVPMQYSGLTAKTEQQLLNNADRDPDRTYFRRLGVDPDLSMDIPLPEGGTALVCALKPYGYIFTLDGRQCEDGDYDLMDRQAAAFESKYSYSNGALKPKSPSDTYKRNAAGQFKNFDADAGATYTYLENYQHANGASKRVYSTGGQWEGEKTHGKNIHDLWLSTLADKCANGHDEEVVFHNAYLMLPSHLQSALERAISKPETCPGVASFTIITNSRETTDLNVINILNESYIQPILKKAPIDNTGVSRLEYREYTPGQVNGRSLHTKVMIFGNDIFVGSANADGRSKFMDANNGMFIQNAPNLVSSYKNWLDKVVRKELTTEARGQAIKAMSKEELIQENQDFLRVNILERWVKDGPDGDRIGLRKAIEKWAGSMMSQLYDATDKAMPIVTSDESKSGQEEAQKKLVAIDKEVELF